MYDQILTLSKDQRQSTQNNNNAPNINKTQNMGIRRLRSIYDQTLTIELTNAKAIQTKCTPFPHRFFFPYFLNSDSNVEQGQPNQTKNAIFSSKNNQLKHIH